MKKNGFISTSLIYTFFILFLLLMLFLLNAYSRNRYLLEQYKTEIKEALYELTSADINLYFMVWNDKTSDYELKEGISLIGYEYEDTFSYCKNGSQLEYLNGKVIVTAERKDLCYSYFRRLTSDITIRMYIKENAASEPIEVFEVPNFTYNLTSSTCTKGSIIFDVFTREFLVRSVEPTTCEVEFTRSIDSDPDIVLRIYTKASPSSTRIKVNRIPDSTYSLTSSNCSHGSITFDTTIRRFKIRTTEPTVCEAEFTYGG